MKGGFNNPPNDVPAHQASTNITASMKGGFNNPPNYGSRFCGNPLGNRFNEGGV